MTDAAQPSDSDLVNQARSLKQLTILLKRNYETLEDVEQHVMDYLAHIYESELRGASLVELNRRFGRIARKFGATPVKVLIGLVNRHKVMTYNYMTANRKGTIAVSTIFQRLLDQIAIDDSKFIDVNWDDVINKQEKLIEKLKRRTLGLPEIE